MPASPASLSRHLLQGTAGLSWPLPFTLTSLAQRWGCPMPRCPSLCYPTFWFPCSFLGTPGCCTWFPCPPLPFPPSSLITWLGVMSTLDSSRCPFLWLCSPCIYNKPFPSYLGAIMSFPSLCPFFPHSVIESLRVGFCVLPQDNTWCMCRVVRVFIFEPLSQIGKENMDAIKRVCVTECVLKLSL